MISLFLEKRTIPFLIQILINKHSISSRFTEQGIIRRVSIKNRVHFVTGNGQQFSYQGGG